MARGTRKLVLQENTRATKASSGSFSETLRGSVDFLCNRDEAYESLKRMLYHCRTLARILIFAPRGRERDEAIFICRRL